MKYYKLRYRSTVVAIVDSEWMMKELTEKVYPHLNLKVEEIEGNIYLLDEVEGNLHQEFFFKNYRKLYILVNVYILL